MAKLHFTQLVLMLADKGFVSLDVEYIDGTKIESKANKYTFVWRKTVDINRTKLLDKISYYKETPILYTYMIFLSDNSDQNIKLIFFKEIRRTLKIFLTYTP